MDSMHKRKEDMSTDRELLQKIDVKTKKETNIYRPVLTKIIN